VVLGDEAKPHLAPESLGNDDTTVLGAARLACAQEADLVHRRMLELECELQLSSAMHQAEGANLLVRAVHRVRGLVTRAWVREAATSLVSAERLARQRFAEARLLEACKKSSFLELEGALEVCERNFVDCGGEAYSQGKAMQQVWLNKLLNEQDMQDEKAGVLSQGVEYVGDLALLSEGDLRQAGVKRVKARKVLPKLVQLGRLAEEAVTKAVDEFERVLLLVEDAV
jgi:hypothetical protein